MNDNRTTRYAFTSQRALEDYFTGVIPRKKVKQIINQVRQTFVSRLPADEPTRRLQLLKKCEFELVRYLRTHPPARKEKG